MSNKLKILCLIGVGCALAMVFRCFWPEPIEGRVTGSRGVLGGALGAVSELHGVEIDIQEQKEEVKNLSYAEAFEVIQGEWEVTEYLDEAVEYHGVEIDDPEYQESQKRNREYVFQEYLGKTLKIDDKNIVHFNAGSDDIFIFATYNELFGLVRNPTGIVHEPPFFVATIQLEGYADWLKIIKSNDDVYLLKVRGLFFKLNKIE